ncbi:ATP-dependent Clp protease ATP-binding subunit [Ligilactobacillus equi]|uniref:ATP-dependent Clp protease ATP-binding subunit n=1 Tax=Ligilactobacillus equi TaxID=137357 RepID=UPI002ED58F38
MKTLNIKELSTLETRQALEKAQEIANQKRHDCIYSEDLLLAMALTKDSGAAKNLGRLRITGKLLQDKINQAITSDISENIDVDDYDLGYASVRKFREDIKGSLLYFHHEKSSGVVTDICSLPLSEFSLTALKYAQEMYDQTPDHEGIDTVWLLESLGQQSKANSFYLLLFILSDLDKLSEISTKAVSKAIETWSHYGRYIDGVSRNEVAEKKAMSNKLYSRIKNPDVSLIKDLAKDLVAEAKAGKIADVIGREKEIRHAQTVLSRKKKPNAILLGKAGVGKTAIVEGLANLIAENKAGVLNGKEIRNLDITRLQENLDVLRKVLNDLSKEKNTIVFIDEIHLLANPKSPVSEIMKPFLARGDISIIGASTKTEWYGTTKNNPALRRRFEEIIVAEPSIKDTTTIVKGSIIPYENHFCLNYDEEVLDKVAGLAKQYFPTRPLPDSALTLIDNTGAVVANRTNKIYQLNQAYQKQMDELKAKLSAAKKLRYNEAEVAKIRLEMQAAETKDKVRSNDKTKHEYEVKVTLKDLLETISEETGKHLTTTDLIESKSGKQRIANLKNTLKSKVIGQDEAISKINRAVLRSKAGLSDPNKPLSVLAFFGPTGVGKTEVAKVIAEEAFDGHLIRYDMSEFNEGSSSSKLLGSAPGFIGYDETESIVDKITEQPNSVVLFDEIEKADPKVFDLFLQLFDEGKLTASNGAVGDFSQALIILTSNLGSKNQVTQINIAATLQSEESLNEDRKHTTMAAVKKAFRPELLNRIDEKVVFNTLTCEDLYQITGLKLAKQLALVEEQGIKVTYDQSVIEFITDKYYDASNGARPINRGITREIMDLLAEAMMTEEISAGDKIKLQVCGSQIQFEILNPEHKYDALEELFEADLAQLEGY